MRSNPAKTLDEIPKGVRIRILRKSKNMFDIRLEAPENAPLYFKRYGSPGVWVPALGYFEVDIQLYRIEPKAFCIHSRAMKGYGPLIYDIAMELATSMDCSLVSGSLDKRASGMSYEPAYKVWTKYLSREDVERTKLTPSLFAKLQSNMLKYNEKRDPLPFMFSYQKQPKLLFSNKIIYNYVQFLPTPSRYLKSVLS